jgi:hypothetical protein
MRIRHAALTALTALTIVASVQATVLTFDITGSTFGNDSPIPATYGNRASGASQGGPGGLTFGYGNFGEGFTPNVAVSYGQPASFANTGYGALVNVAYGSGGVFSMTFTADPGFNVSLYSFDLAGLDQSYQINSVSVLSGATTLFTQSNVIVNGSSNGTGVTSFAFNPILTRSTLTVQVNASNLGANGANIGIDNIRIAQVVVPEPSVTALAIAGAALGVALTRRFRRS